MSEVVSMTASNHSAGRVNFFQASTAATARA